MLFSRGKDTKVENAAPLFSSKLEKRPLQKLIIGGTATTLTAAYRQQRIGVNSEKQIPANWFVVIISGFASTDRKGLADTLAAMIHGDPGPSSVSCKATGWVFS